MCELAEANGRVQEHAAEDVGGESSLSLAFAREPCSSRRCDLERAGAEVQFALEKQKWGDDRWEKQLLVGPNLSARIASQSLKVYATVLVGLTGDAKKVDSFLILACGF